MKRATPFILLTLTILLAVLGQVCADNKFTEIGGGVAGSNHEKFEFLMSLSGIFGGFLVVLGVLSFATRSRFEGLVGMVTGRAFEAVTVVPVVLIVLGSLMVLAYFF